MHLSVALMILDKQQKIILYSACNIDKLLRPGIGFMDARFYTNLLPFRENLYDCYKGAQPPDYIMNILIVPAPAWKTISCIDIFLQDKTANYL